MILPHNLFPVDGQPFKRVQGQQQRPSPGINIIKAEPVLDVAQDGGLVEWVDLIHILDALVVLMLVLLLWVAAGQQPPGCCGGAGILFPARGGSGRGGGRGVDVVALARVYRVALFMCMCMYTCVWS